MKNFFMTLENNKVKIFELIAIILILIFSFSITPKQLQNDIFYTIKIGNLIQENGIDGADHFSWHEGLPYTYPHWLYDVGMSLIYNFGGFNTIYISTCIFSCILGIFIYFVNSKLNKDKLISFAVTIAVLYLIKGYITARAQLITFILFILLVYNIEKFIENKKAINAVALLLIQTLIANLHAAVWPFSFVLYLPYVAEYLIAELQDVVLYKKLEILLLKNRAKKLNQKLSNRSENSSQITKFNSEEELNSKGNKINLKTSSKKKVSSEKYVNKLQRVTEKLLQKQGKAQKIRVKREQNKGKEYKVIIKKNKNVRWLILIMIIAIFTGFLTPLGKAPFTYTYLTLKGTTTKNINEHLPLTLANNAQMACTLVVVLALITFTKVRIRLSDLFMLGGLVVLMFLSRRQQSMFVLIGSIAFTRLSLQFAEANWSKPVDNVINKFFTKYTAFILIAVMLAWSLHLYAKVKDDSFVNEKTYPVEGAEWILQNLDVKNIKLYNEYNYGSYLLFNGIPVFIDSRADLYAPEFNTPTGNEKDGNDIFMDFINSSNISTYYGDIFEKYEITHILVYRNSKIAMLIRKADSEKYNEIYEDKYFVIYEVCR